MLGGGKDAKTLMPGPSRFGLFGSLKASPRRFPPPHGRFEELSRFIVTVTIPALLL
jgi:hypothetical protein